MIKDFIEHIKNAFSSSVDAAATAAGSATVAKVGTGTTFVGAGSAGISNWLFSSQGGVAVSMCIAVLGFIMNWYFKKREYRFKRKLDIELQQAKLKAIADGLWHNE